jgi:hypothetical protein
MVADVPAVLVTTPDLHHALHGEEFPAEAAGQVRRIGAVGGLHIHAGNTHLLRGPNQ